MIGFHEFVFFKQIIQPEGGLGNSLNLQLVSEALGRLCYLEDCALKFK